MHKPEVECFLIDETKYLRLEYLSYYTHWSQHFTSNYSANNNFFPALSLGVTFTALAEADNSTWLAFVTMQDFQQRAASAKGLSDAYFLELLPIVSDESRAEWEEYSVANKAWLSEVRAYQERFALGTRRKLIEEGDQVTGDVVWLLLRCIMGTLSTTLR
jgi:hypothetical protein